MAWGLLVFVVGLAYGWWTPGKQDKWAIFKSGVLAGLVLALLAALLGWVLGLDPLGGVLGAGALGVFLGAVLLTLLFTLGVSVGDWVEGVRAKGADAAGRRV